MVALLQNIILVSISSGLLVLPVFLLFLVSMSHLKMCMVVLAFAILFNVVLCSTTSAKPENVFVASSAHVFALLLV
jgi:hypothetical protein